MGKKINFPFRYELKIPEELKGEMEPDLIRWCMQNKWLIKQIRERISSIQSDSYTVDVAQLDGCFEAVDVTDNDLKANYFNGNDQR